MKKIYYTLFFLFSICLTSLTAQEQLTSFSSGFISNNIEYVGTYQDKLFYMEIDNEKYDLRVENLTDTDIQSESLMQFPLDDYDFENYALSEGMIILISNQSILRYDIGSGEILSIDLQSIDANDSPVVALGNAYYPISDDALAIVDISTGEISSREIEPSISFDRFAFNDGNFIVLPGIKLPVIYTDKSVNMRHLGAYNLVEGTMENFYSFDQSDVVVSPNYSKNAAHLPVVNINSGDFKLFTLLHENQEVEFDSQSLSLDPTLSLGHADSEFAYNFEIGLGSGWLPYTYTIQDMITGEVNSIEIRVSEFDLREKIKYIDKTGAYVVQNNELSHIGLDGNENVILTGFVEDDISFPSGDNFRNSKSPQGELVVNYRTADGSFKHVKVNPEGVGNPTEGSVLRFIYDESKNLSYAITQGVDSEVQISSYESEFIELTEDEEKSLQGGIFTATDNSFMYTSNDVLKTEVFDLSGDINSVSMSMYRGDYSNYTRVGDRVLATNRFINFEEKRLLFQFGLVQNLTTNARELIIRRIESIQDGLVKAKAVVSQAGSLQLATLDFEGNFTSFVDENDPSRTEVVPNTPLLVNVYDLSIAMIGDYLNGAADLVAIGGELTEPKSILSNFNYFDSGPIRLIEEGEVWTYMSADRYFFINSNGETIEAPMTAEVPRYEDGRFYFSDKYFDETSGDFTDWESGLTSVKLIKNDKAYGFQGDDLAMVDLNTLAMTNFGTTSMDLEFYSGKNNVLFFDPNTRAVSWTDGIETALQIQALPSNMIVGEFRTSLGDDFLFSGMNETVGSELFTLSSEGEMITSDLNLGEKSSSPSDFIVNDDFIYFQAYNDDNGFQLYTINVALALSIDDKGFVNRPVSFSPNPTSDVVTVDVDFKFETAVIYDHMGKLVSKQASNNNGTVDLRELQIGIYYIQLLSPNGITGTCKVMKQ